MDPLDIAELVWILRITGANTLDCLEFAIGNVAFICASISVPKMPGSCGVLPLRFCVEGNVNGGGVQCTSRE